MGRYSAVRPDGARSGRVSKLSVLAVLGLLVSAVSAGPALAATSAQADHSGRVGLEGRAAPRPDQTPLQASEVARRTGRAVLVTGATTPDSTLTANPNGTFSVTESAGPVRAKVDGQWRGLNARLVHNGNGTFSPEVSTEPLTLSGGGSVPLATMKYGVYSMALTAPMRLPAPVIAGNAATYRDVLPGVNLVVSAQTSGGFDESLVAATAAAASNPALRALTFNARLNGLSLKAGWDDSINAVARNGAVIFAAPPPRMWNSAVNPALKTIEISGLGRVSKATGMAALSSISGPGASARTEPMGVRIAGNRITLVPDRSALTGPGPIYLDPTWLPGVEDQSSWAYVSNQTTGIAAQDYYGTSNYLQVGQNPCSGCGQAFSFYTLPVPGGLTGATINSVTAYFPEVWADSCNASPVDLYATSSISKSTTYNKQPTWGANLGSDNVAYNWSSTGDVGGPSSCASGAKEVSFSASPLVNEVANTVLPDGWPSLTVGLQAEDTSDYAGWKLFANPDSGAASNDQGPYAAIGGNASWTINYAYAPAKPALSTSPTADCTNGASVLGNGSVMLVSTDYDKDGHELSGGLSTAFTVYAAGNPADSIVSKSVALPMGLNDSGMSQLQLPQTELDTDDSKWGSGGVMKVTWTAQASLTDLSISGPTATCSFTYSTAVPGQPVVNDSAGNPCGTTTSPVTYTVGTAATFTVQKNASSSVQPTSYTYQLNAGNPITVSAGSSSPYSSTLSIKPTRFTNVLIVNAVAAGGNIGQAAYCYFNAEAPAPAIDQDMTGDGIPDLLTAGNGTTGTASGLWLAAGQASSGRFDGTVDTTASDIAPNGPQDVSTPASWNGLKAFTGEFTDSGFNDIEAYDPGTGNAYVLPGQGDGSATTSQEQNLTDVFEDVNQVSQDTNYPQQLVNAYDVSADGSSYPDEIGMFTDPDSAVGSYLAYFANNDGFGDFDAANYLGYPYELVTGTGAFLPSPDGTTDWNDWTVTTDSDTRGGTNYTDMYLWDSQTGALYLWELTGLENETPGGFDSSTFSYVNPTATLEYTQTEISPAWNKGTSFALLQGTDIDGSPGLIAVTAAGQVESYEYANGTLTQVNGGVASQTLDTASHTYLLNDGTSGEASSARDQAGAGVTGQNVTGNSATCWNVGDLFSPDVVFNNNTTEPSCGTTSGFMITGTQSGLFAPNSSFTISAWIDPIKLGGVVLSQNGSEDSTVEVSSTTGGQWSVSMGSGNSTSGYITAAGGTAHAGMWANVVVTYTTTGGADVMKLYVDGVEVGYAVDTSPSSTTGKFLLGANQVNGVASNFLDGQLADVQVWDSVATPAEPGTSASVFVPITPYRIMDTRSATQIGSVTGPVAADATVLVPIEGSTTNGVDLPASGITAVAVAITVTGETSGGVLTAYPAQTPQPTTSTVNYSTGITTTNDAVVPVGPDGDIAVFNAAGGTAQLLVDVTGYFTTNISATNASTYTPLTEPTNILDTRNGTGAPEGAIAADGTLKLMIDGDDTNGVDLPATGVTAVALNLTAVPTASGESGSLTAYEDGIPRPVATTMTYQAEDDEPQAGMVLIPVGSDGEVDIFNFSSTTVNLVGELSGYFTTSSTGQYYHPLDSTRIIDTRNTTALAADSGINIADPASVLADNPTLVLNITVTQPADSGNLIEYPGTAAQPDVSVINFASGETIPNLALVSSATNNSFNIYNNSAGTAQVVVDTDGYFE
jgi:concanavalin A-like lectin/glucanase superfamily protein